MATLMRVIAAAIGVLLCVSAAQAGAARKPKVLFLHSIGGGHATWAADVVSKLQESGVFAQVDSWNGGASTPTLVQLKAYDAVMVTNEGMWSDRTALGNVMSQYVDAGYGVVQTMYTVAGTLPINTLGGTWTAEYNCITFGPYAFGEATLGTIAVPDHATMIGVESFNGGQNSLRPAGTALTAGATLIASWSDGKPLVVVGPKINRVDLGFFPPSFDASFDGWDASTDGVKLMVNALLYTIRPKVLVVYSFGNAEKNDVVAKLSATGTLGGVDSFNAASGTPTLDQLQNYDAVLVANYASSSLTNPTALGNVIADYVDWGGGVVQSMFATAGASFSTLGGRFADDYRIIDFGGPTSGAAILGAVVYPNHPIMAGVVAIDGGAASFRPSLTTLAPGGVAIAYWSDGKTMVAVSTKRPNRVDLGFYAPSRNVESIFWTGDGDKLMANALLYASKPYVACVASDTAFLVSDVATKLVASRRFSGVVGIAGASTPAAATLSLFGGVIVWSDAPYSNPTAFGNRLADYIDAGGAGVTALLANVNVSGFPGTNPRGRWVSEGYDIAPTNSLPELSSGSQAFVGTILEPNNPITRFVRKFDGGTNSPRMDSVVSLRGRPVMNWSDGKMLASVHNFRKRVDLGFWPPSDSSTNGWNHRTDGTWIMANALEYAVRHAPCPGDLNGDGFVDDTDFVLFAGYYDAFLDPRGDLTGDGLTEDSDFVVFAAGYDALVCP